MLAQKKLFKFDNAGQSALQIELKNIADKLDDPKYLVLNPYDASLWVSGEKSLLHADAQGRRLGAWQVSGEIQAMQLDVDESLWLFTHESLLHLSPQGVILHNLELKSQVKEPEYLALDSLGGLLWVAGKKELVQLESNHLDQAPRPVAVSNVTDGDDKKILALAVDPLLGNLWVVTKQNQLFIYDRETNLLKTVDFGSHDLGEVQTLVFEPVSASFWLGGKKAVERFTSNGDLAARIAVDEEAEVIGVASFRLSPTLTLLEPENGGLTNNPHPPIRLGLGTSCNAVPCLLPDTYNQSLVLSVDLNGSPIGSLFTRSVTEASYVSPIRLPEGLNALGAQAVDLFGHPSNRISANFVVDTIPPQFLSVTPADGANVPQSEAAITGTLDDPTANVMLLDGNGSVVAAGGAAFNFVAPLKPGTNLFTLLARDPAGNESSLLLRLLHSSLSVKFTSPAAGTVLDRMRVLVSGTFQGPVNTGISVNGTVALVSGDRFLLNLDLEPGPNALTATATTLDGVTATDTLIVSVSQTEADPFEITITPAAGTAPLPVRFSVGNFSGQTIMRVELDIDGDGSTDSIVTDLSEPVEVTYANPGIYPARVKIIYGQNQSYEQTMAVVIHDAMQMDTQFTTLWNGTNEALIRGDVSTALTYLNEGAKRKYGPVFQVLKPHMPQIIASYSPLRRVSISEDIGEYAIVRNFNGQNRVYLIYFLRDADGVWRMDAM
ncbi:hypothetical protein SCL_1021 [Sulfuricaulis limicola]|uniref:PKD domain-containing protein n=2 Tax=Sulfuricaulis limicola TaxID=1620215 RepID=A0A1B4XEV8_9GAMM|nr:hypothetical protein SCL_1021 [Sulfuricaulis limicola]